MQVAGYASVIPIEIEVVVDLVLGGEQFATGLATEAGLIQHDTARNVLK